MPEKNSTVSILIRSSDKVLAYLGLVPNQPQPPAGIQHSVIKHEVKVKQIVKKLRGLIWII